MRKLFTSAVLSVATMTLGACASPRPPTKDLNAASGAIRAAEEVGANKQPQAALHLTLARESLGEAERLIAEERMVEARRMLERARADAELAIVVARVAATRAEAAEVHRKADVLEQQTLQQRAAGQAEQ